MLISNIIIGNILFGSEDNDLSSIGNTAFFCFEFMCGNFKFHKLKEISPILGYFFGLIFITCFVFLMIPYFYGIILYNYG